MKVVLIGDSIRMGYQPLVAKKCKEFDVWGPYENCRHSLWALDHFIPWVAEQKPDVLHFNFGVHDASILPDGQHQVLLAQYRLCLQRFINVVKELENTRMIWATTTPLYMPDESKPMAQWEVMTKAEIKQYNASANDETQYSNKKMTVEYHTSIESRIVDVISNMMAIFMVLALLSMLIIFIIK